MWRTAFSGIWRLPASWEFRGCLMVRSKPKPRPTIGVIGGSGLYEMEGWTGVREVA